MLGLFFDVFLVFPTAFFVFVSPFMSRSFRVLPGRLSAPFLSSVVRLRGTAGRTRPFPSVVTIAITMTASARIVSVLIATVFVAASLSIAAMPAAATAAAASFSLTGSPVSSTGRRFSTVIVVFVATGPGRMMVLSAVAVLVTFLLVRCHFCAVAVSRLAIDLVLLRGVGAICSCSRRLQTFPSDLFHDPPVAGIVLFLGSLRCLSAIQSGLLDLFGFRLGFLALLLGLKLVKAPALGQFHLSQGLRQVGGPGFLQEIPVVQRPRSRQTLRRIELQQLFDEVDGPGSVVVHLRLVPLPQLGTLAVRFAVDADVSRPQQLEFPNARPRLAGGGSHHVEDELKLVHIGLSREERTSQHELRQNAARAPDVHREAVPRRSQQELRRTIPQRDDLVGELLRISPVV
mmetsp:Transcript_12934/g.30514  ORF Transcript_12934/g.30514 Transcript_12934/m.30514 type:complete len:402 (+) Transcript_12934:1161-2366(+)